jgi:protein-disulfide isomerase
MTTPFQMTLGQLTEPVTDDDHIRGPATAPVTLVEYGDYQCPYCGAAHPIVKELLRQRPTEVRMVYRHFPLTNVHQYAELAAEVAEAAGARRQFWQMHDWLFTHQEELSPVTLRLGVEQLGLSVEEIDQELRDHLHLDRIRRDFIGGVRSGVNGTPTFFINGIRHDQGYTLPELLLAVDEAANTR